VYGTNLQSLYIFSFNSKHLLLHFISHWPTTITGFNLTVTSFHTLLNMHLIEQHCQRHWSCSKICGTMFLRLSNSTEILNSVHFCF